VPEQFHTKQKHKAIRQFSSNDAKSMGKKFPPEKPPIITVGFSIKKAPVYGLNILTH
jgi:hypothetical protein